MKFIHAAVFLFIPVWTSAQPLSIEQCRMKALQHNRSLAAARVKLEQTRFDAKAYKANYYPQINVTAIDLYSLAHGSFEIDGGQLPIYKYVGSESTYVPDVTENADGTYQLNQYADFPSQTFEWKMKNLFIGNISIVEPIYAGGKISTAYKMAKLGTRIATENIRLTESEVIVKTDEAYCLAAKTAELADVARSYREMLEELKKNVEAAMKHGMSTRNDLMKVQVKLNEANLSIQKAENAHSLAIMNLCHIIGVPINTSISILPPDTLLADMYPPLAVHDSALSVSSRPEYAMIEQKTEIARQNIKLAKSDYLPNVSLSASYTYLDGGTLAGRKLANSGAATVALAVNVPVNIFGGASAKVNSARAAHQIAQLEQQDLNEKMQLELLQCQNTFEEAHTQLNLCQTALLQAAEHVRLSKQQYEVGFEMLSNYLESQFLWQQSSANLVEARWNLFIAHTRLLKAQGELR
ncbi:MAG: TolC family protein [Bacteroidaceae bacterium]|nr:TolC family protein [Bacteroidaceae bacterium]